jgi:hypothetical protein
MMLLVLDRQTRCSTGPGPEVGVLLLYSSCARIVAEMFEVTFPNLPSPCRASKARLNISLTRIEKKCPDLFTIAYASEQTKDTFCVIVK